MADLVYLVGAFSPTPNGNCAAVKIGITNDIENRMRQLQNGHHLPLTALCVWEVETREEALRAEKRAHAQFRARRLCGEWFAPPYGEILAFMTEVLGEGKKSARVNRKSLKGKWTDERASLRDEVAKLQQLAAAHKQIIEILEKTVAVVQERADNTSRHLQEMHGHTQRMISAALARH